MIRSAERGFALLEVLVATAILSVAALSLAELLDAGVRAVATARTRELEQADEDRLLSAYTLLAREDLDRRLGKRALGPYVVSVQRPEPTLYRIALSRGEAPEVENLVTVVYRREPQHVP